MFMNVKRVGSVIVLALLVTVGFNGQASALHSWGNYHWARTANPFSVKLGNNLSGGWQSYLATSSTDWSASSVLDTQIVTGGTSSRTCKATTGRVEVCNAKYGNNGWLGLASIWISGDHITKGTVKLNDTYMQKAPYNTVAEKNHVMCQEIGHTFGLAHQDETGADLGTCMDYSSSLNGQHPNAHDYEELETIYAHLDSTTTLASSTSNSGRQNIDDDNGNWGVRVHRSKNGRSEVYVRSDANNQKVITFVNLAW